MLSVIIATKDSERPLVLTLAALVPGAMAGIVREVIVADAGSGDATARVAHLLCETAVRMNSRDGRLDNPFTQQQIADITGQTSVNVNRVLADMERQGLIRRKGREIDFVDWPEMRRVGSFQPAYLEI